jgi:ADP-ribose pyrophosphatase YjhB (NUDIX family)
MKYCCECGQSIVIEIPKGDNKPRHVCTHCKTIHYINPKIVAGTLPIYEGKVLLCKRAIEPRYGYWTLPAGFMELNETVAEAAERETWEEAAAKVRLGSLYTLINIPYIGQVHVFYRAELLDGVYGAGEESLETRLFAIEDIPWKELAFRSVRLTLEKYLRDIEKGSFDEQSTELLLAPPPGWEIPKSQ